MAVSHGYLDWMLCGGELKAWLEGQETLHRHLVFWRLHWKIGTFRIYIRILHFYKRMVEFMVRRFAFLQNSKTSIINEGLVSYLGSTWGAMSSKSWPELLVYSFGKDNEVFVAPPRTHDVRFVTQLFVNQPILQISRKRLTSPKRHSPCLHQSLAIESHFRSSSALSYPG